MRENTKRRGRLQRGIQIVLALLLVLSTLGTGALALQGERQTVNQFFANSTPPTPPPQPTPTPGGGGGYDSINITVNKAWSGDTSDVRPGSVQVQLYRNGNARGNPVTLNSGNNWRHIWYSLSDGFNYTVEEVNVPSGYTVAVSRSGNTFTITNTYGVPPTPTPPPPTPPPAVTSVTVSKVWAGEGEHPASVEAVLYKDGSAFATAALFASNSWRYAWTDLDPTINWVVGEKDVPEGYDVKVENLGDGIFVITNTKKLVPTENTVVISGAKTWRHGANTESQRPANVTIYIKANGVTVNQVILSYETDWKYEVLMPKFDESGAEITYTVEEKDIHGYTSVVKGFNITNIHDSSSDGGPKTGDNSTLWLWFVLLLASSAALRFLLRDVVLFRKKE